jgi:hypothetical protein
MAPTSVTATASLWMYLSTKQGLVGQHFEVLVHPLRPCLDVMDDNAYYLDVIWMPFTPLGRLTQPVMRRM